ncbi:MAG: hypothetical protein AAF654_01560 [Myxococcota bacterium]
MSGELPDTGDPFELLGVEPTVDEVGLRRAYSRLVRRFRPERAPEEFKRIRKAFDEAKQRLEYRRLYAYDDDGLEPEVDGAEGVVEDLLEAARPDTKPVIVDDPVPDPEPASDGAAESPSGLEAVPDSLPTSRAPILLLEYEENDRVDLEHSAEQGDRDAVRAALDDPKLRGRVLRDDRTAHTVSCALVYLTWYEPDAADAGFERLGIDPKTLSNDLADALNAAQVYASEEKKGFSCDELRDFMALSHWVGDLDSAEATAALAFVAAEDPDRILLALDRLGGQDPHFWARAFDVVQHWGLEDEDTQFDGLIETELKRIDSKLETHRIARFENLLALAMMAASAAAFARFGWWGLPWFAAVVVVWIWSISKTDVRLYRLVVRPSLGRFVVREGVPGARLAVVLKRVTKLADNVGRFKREIQDDWGLVWMGALGAMHGRAPDSTRHPNL